MQRVLSDSKGDKPSITRLNIKNVRLVPKESASTSKLSYDMTKFDTRINNFPEVYTIKSFIV